MQAAIGTFITHKKNSPDAEGSSIFFMCLRVVSATLVLPHIVEQGELEDFLWGKKRS